MPATLRRLAPAAPAPCRTFLDHVDAGERAESTVAVYLRLRTLAATAPGSIPVVRAFGGLRELPSDAHWPYMSGWTVRAAVSAAVFGAGGRGVEPACERGVGAAPCGACVRCAAEAVTRGGSEPGAIEYGPFLATRPAVRPAEGAGPVRPVAVAAEPWLESGAEFVGRIAIRRPVPTQLPTLFAALTLVGDRGGAEAKPAFRLDLLGVLATEATTLFDAADVVRGVQAGTTPEASLRRRIGRLGAPAEAVLGDAARLAAAALAARSPLSRIPAPLFGECG